MEKSNSGMMGHGMPIESTNTIQNKQTKKSKQPNGTSFKQSNVDPIFNLVKLQDEQIHIVVGDNIVSHKTFKTFKKADEYLASKPYEILINVASLIMFTLKKNETETKNEETK